MSVKSATLIVADYDEPVRSMETSYQSSYPVVSQI